MTNSADTAEKGYFNALVSGYFKTAADGGKLFFPWGVYGRGYIIPSEQDYEQLHRQLKISMIAVLALIFCFVTVRLYVFSFVVATLATIFYVAWASYLTRGLRPSDERMSLRENMVTQARTHNATTLWLMEVASLAFMAFGLVMLFASPDKWLVALFVTILFGFSAAAIAHLIVLRWRTS
jgi:Ca2+/Na+ antiporter